MLEAMIYFDFAMLILDCVTISELRKFLLDFLRVKKSRKNANQLYASQSFRERITLSFIKTHLKKYIAEFTTFHRIYMAVLYTLIPQYMILIGSNVLMGKKSMYVLCFFAAIKLIIGFWVWIHIDANRVSIYRKK